MKEALFILFVLAILFAFTAYKYRRQIRTAREFWRMAKEIRNTHSRAAGEFGAAKVQDPTKLVNCSKCGTWVPEEMAVRLGRSAVFCSAQCLEKAARVN